GGAISVRPSGGHGKRSAGFMSLLRAVHRGSDGLPAAPHGRCRCGVEHGCPPTPSGYARSAPMYPVTGTAAREFRAARAPAWRVLVDVVFAVAAPIVTRIGVAVSGMLLDVDPGHDDAGEVGAGVDHLPDAGERHGARCLLPADH